MSTYQYGLALDALGDPTRRAILELLRDGPKPVVELAGALPVSRPAVSQHLRVLKAAGLVADRAAGSRRLYAVDPAGLDVLRAYLEGLWGQALASYQQAAEGRGHPSTGGSDEEGER
ncbi:MAG TPA: metalloregulator ArsR/SmtB family transcription factor [Actinomycetes bacterium]|nr:metalloregulator ArsR/SmtB family transcription factor [Actinomycetes bacterium]